jgi:hypothetical protein
MVLLTIQNHAIDLNESSEIIEQASQATIEIQGEIETIINQDEVMLQDETIIIEPIIIDEQNLTLIDTNSIDENLTLPITTEEENSSIPSPTIESVLDIEDNLTAEVNNTIEENNNSTLNKETFDMSLGNLEKGEEIYKKRLKEICDTTKAELAEYYSQDEWEVFASEGKFEDAIFEICPQIEPSYNKEWSEDLYQFYYQNARDSEVIPDC